MGHAFYSKHEQRHGSMNMLMHVLFGKHQTAPWCIEYMVRAEKVGYCQVAGLCPGKCEFFQINQHLLKLVQRLTRYLHLEVVQALEFIVSQTDSPET